MKFRSIVCLSILATVLVASQCAEAGNGDLLEREPVSLDTDKLLEGVPEERKDALTGRISGLAGSVEISRITYESDGLKVRGYSAAPREGTDLPCVIFNRGGNRDFGALNDLRAALILGEIAHRGYYVVASQYRGVDGGDGQEEFGGAEIQDVLSLIPLLESIERADASRIGMYGWSRGGMMTYIALAKTDRIRAAVVGAGVADAFASIKNRPEMEEHVISELVPDWENNREAAFEARSALRWPEKLHKETPILILHGTSDWRVNPNQALGMAGALLEARHPYRLMMFEGGDHGLSEFRDEVDAAVGAWLDRYVRDGEKWPSLEPHGR
jgi:dipeptidyl aminopeptidase/acylaminoacyl peptidase